MKRVMPNNIYKGLPCSVVSVGCALGVDAWSGLNGLFSSDLKSNGFLSFKAMNALIRANMAVAGRSRYNREDRPVLREFAHANPGRRAILCVGSHYVYFDGKDYYSFFFNGDCKVMEIWWLE